MPALQVRDFPAALYGELKECAASNHRSIAQQTIIAIEEMLSAASVVSSDWRQSDLVPPSSYSEEEGFSFSAGKNVIGRNEGYSAREARQAKRRRLFAEFDKICWKDSTFSTDDIVAMVREGRDELSDRDGSVSNLIDGSGVSCVEGALR